MNRHCIDNLTPTKNHRLYQSYSVTVFISHYKGTCCVVPEAADRREYVRQLSYHGTLNHHRSKVKETKMSAEVIRGYRVHPRDGSFAFAFCGETNIIFTGAIC